MSGQCHVPVFYSWLSNDNREREREANHSMIIFEVYFRVRFRIRPRAVPSSYPDPVTTRCEYSTPLVAVDMRGQLSLLQALLHLLLPSVFSCLLCITSLFTFLVTHYSFFPSTSHALSLSHSLHCFSRFSPPSHLIYLPTYQRFKHSVGVKQEMYRGQ